MSSNHVHCTGIPWGLVAAVALAVAAALALPPTRALAGAQVSGRGVMVLLSQGR